MNNINILDCTLRDGGYVNQWQFGEKNIKKIISKLVESKIDIIECGFLSKKTVRNKDCSIFDSVSEVKDYLPNDRGSSTFVCMINFGEFAIEDIPTNDKSSIDGIRIAFHKKDKAAALKLCKEISDKGYLLFMQPMVAVSYTDEEFIDLIKEANKIMPFAFYIVDSFGVMRRNDLMRLYYLVDHNLEKSVTVGYHSHNNIQMAYSNAQALVDLKTKRKLIFDSSVFGMGRGAGNLNTELFIEYLNDFNGSDYKTKPLLQIIDEVLNNIYLNTYWGYSLPHYISSKHNCHPNYASHLSSKDTLKAEDISNILMKMDEEKKNNFDKDYIENLYHNYQAHMIDDSLCKIELKKLLKNKTVLSIAPGGSINDEIRKINKIVSEKNVITISVNFNPEKIKSDYVFVSNIKRYDDLKNKKLSNLITTSNINTESTVKYKVNYINLLNEIPSVSDNAGLMLIKLLVELGVKSIKLAGYDGYSYDSSTNYAEKDMTFIKKKNVADSLNKGVKKIITEYSKQVDIEFITKSKYLKMEE